MTKEINVILNVREDSYIAALRIIVNTEVAMVTYIP